MEFTREMIEEFWNKPFTCNELTLTRKSWIPDKYNCVAKEPDYIVQLATNVIYDLLVGNETDAVKHLLKQWHVNGWYFGCYAKEEEINKIKEIENRLQKEGNESKENAVAIYFFGSRDFKKVEDFCMPIFGDLFFYKMFHCEESPLYQGKE